MDDQNDVVDADVVTDESEEEISEKKVVHGDQATILLSLEELIKNNIAALDNLQIELRKNREMFDDGFTNNPTYKEHDEKAKAAAKIKAETKHQLMQQPAVKLVAEKIKSISAEMKERKSALSDYLLEYQRMANVNEIEALDGTIREIINEAKLVKRTSNN